MNLIPITAVRAAVYNYYALTNAKWCLVPVLELVPGDRNDNLRALGVGVVWVRRTQVVYFVNVVHLYVYRRLGLIGATRY